MDGFLVVDSASIAFVLALAAGFFVSWRWSRHRLHLQVGMGFTLLGAGYTFLLLSYLPRFSIEGADAARGLCQSAGALLLYWAYASYHVERQRPLLLLVATAAGMMVLGGVLAITHQAHTALFVSTTRYLAIAHSISAAAFLGCTLLAARGWHRRPSLLRSLVPVGFLCWTFSTYTWLVIDVSGDRLFVPVAYAWRFAAILLMLGAMVWPRRRDAQA